MVGLGNPEEKYEKTRLNIGFRAIDKIAADFCFPPFNFQSSFNAEISKGTIEEKKVILAKPMTFMNLSGKSVSKIVQFHKINPEKLVVIHDDVDILLGKLKIIESKGAGGHKGVDSIIRETGKDFVRIRIGVSPERKPRNTKAFVLQKFKKEEELLTGQVLEKTVKAVEILVKEGIGKSSSLFSKK